MPQANSSIRILLHAPTAAAVARARSNSVNLLKQTHPVEVRIVVSGDAVQTVLDAPEAVADSLTLVCPSTLSRIGRDAPAPLSVLDEGAVFVIARMQAEGWRYVRA